MEKTALGSLPMSNIECMLKEAYLQRPDLEGRIVTAGELAEYITWLIQTRGRGVTAASLDLDRLLLRENEAFSKLAARIAENPADTEAQKSLFSAYRTHRETQYIIGSYDLSVGRMLRYMPAHWHNSDHFEVYYCAAGSCPIFFEDFVITMRAGTVLILAPSVTHASPCYADDSLLYYYLVRSSTFDEVFWHQLPHESLMATFFRKTLNAGGKAAYLHFETGRDEKIEHKLSEINEEYAAPEAYSAQMLNVLMSEFFLLLLRGYEGTARLPRTEEFYWKHEFSAIFSFIQAHYCDMTLSEIARQVGYSERQISRITMSCIGENYTRLVQRLRMERAAALLRRKNVPIESVAELCGYSTVSSFYRAFIAYYGCAPAKYRKNADAGE